ncbi:hypothetical protein AN958_06930 [Leucoagaricus sp. SymC.cos]|nr:hypothetical protein AN958_06930 [Leucoagaricus sp. SymC.cos]
MVLTPDSTGSPPEPKRAKRQAAYYPNLNSGNKPVKPFSRSAAKRESVMALGSIEHLQHYFTRTGLSSKKNPLERAQYGLVPAIGRPGHVPATPSAGSLKEFNLPPSPAIPSPPRQILEPHVKSHDIDPDTLLPGVCEDLASVAHAWSINNSADTSITSPQPVDVLEILKATTRAIRSVRNYLLSLPDESAGTIRANFRATVLGPGKPNSNPKDVSDPLTRIRRSALEVLTMLRAIEEKCRLPLSDEAYDAQSDGGGSRGDPHSRFASPSNPTAELPPEEARSTPESIKAETDGTFTYSLVQVNGRYQQVPVWEEEEDVFQVQEEEEKEKRERWDERLVLAGGWLYKQDIKLSELERERIIVSGYLNTVDEVLFEAELGTERGWERERKKYQRQNAQLRTKGRRVSAGDGEGKGLGNFLSINGGGKRRVSTGMVDMLQSVTLTEEPEDMAHIEEGDEPEETIEDDLLPEWARRNSFIDDELGWVHTLLSLILPKDLLNHLGSPASPSDFLDSLSSGQLLCITYNAIVRKSKKPWGYISKDSIHDIIALEKAGEESSKEGQKKGWTFRRSDNLRLWVGALKIRYLLSIQVPSIKPSLGFGLPSTPSAPVIHRQPSSSTSEPFVFFDAKVIARKEEGWEEMLKTVLLLWVQKVVDERRLYQ